MNDNDRLDKTDPFPVPQVPTKEDLERLGIPDFRKEAHIKFIPFEEPETTTHFRIRHDVHPTITPITLTPDYTRMTTDPRTSMPYSEFVTTTFAYASKNFFLESFQAIGVNKAPSPETTTPTTWEEADEKYICSLQEETRQLRDLGSAYTDQVDHLCRSIDILHIGLALAGEAFELLQGMKKLTDNEVCDNIGLRAYLPPGIRAALDEVLKEIGDLFYYSQMLSNMYHLEINLTNPDTWLDDPGPCSEDKFIATVEQLVDYIKRIEVYHQDYNPVQMGDYVFNLIEVLHGICLFLGYPAEEIVDMNRAKLIKRYPSGSFSTQESAAKADANPSTPSTPA